MKEGRKIAIIPSVALNELKLSDLATRTGIIVEVIKYKNEIKGCWVLLDGAPYLNEAEWYIPTNSLVEL